VLPPDVNSSEAECTLDGQGRVRVGLGYVKGVGEPEVRELVAARHEAGRFRSLADLASRAGAGSPSLELLAWSGACDSLAGDPPGGHNGELCPSSSTPRNQRDKVHSNSPPTASARHRCARRLALWQLGVAAPGKGVPGGVQLALPLDLPAPPRLRGLSGWESMLADYGATGLTVHAHPLALLRPHLAAEIATSRDLDTLPHGTRVKTGGMVVARQRPGTANGIVFVLLEDEHGTINLIVPSSVYERHRLTVRTEPLMLVEGKLERFAAAGGATNVLVDRIGSIDAPDRPMAEVKDFSMLDEQVRRGLQEQRSSGPPREPAEADTDGFRAVAPPVLSFASGRRR
jgi:error-prone DNA polymerase